ncbi:hypothetical protein EC988_008702, partial [Linderina pennispora]
MSVDASRGIEVSSQSESGPPSTTQDIKGDNPYTQKGDSGSLTELSGEDSRGSHMNRMLFACASVAALSSINYGW